MDQADAELRQTICKVFYILCHFNIIYQSSIYRNYQNQVIILIIISSPLFCKISRCGLMREEIKWIFWSLPKMVSICGLSFCTLHLYFCISFVSFVSCVSFGPSQSPPFPPQKLARFVYIYLYFFAIIFVFL